MKRRMKLRTKMLLLSFILVSSSVIVSGLSMLYSISYSFEKEIRQRAIAISRTVAQLDEIRDYLGKEGGARIIQPVAERIRLATNVDYIVILDMNRIRYSHPSESRIGERFEGGDEGAAFSELEYTSKAKGTLGYAIRAFVPIMDREGIHQVGVAVVGILAPTFESYLAEYQSNMLLSLVWGLSIGLIGSWIIANSVKKQTHQLEPFEIGRLLEERSAVMEAMDIGIISIDINGKVNFMNRVAEQYTKVATLIDDAEDLTLSQLFSGTWLMDLNFVNQKIQNKPISIHGTMYLISSYPLHVHQDLVGSVVTIKSRSDAHQLAEELTGIKNLVGALRAQNHEYMNKLHSIAGLIQLDRTEEALNLMIDETSQEENLVQFLKDNIDDYAVSGLLLGKRSRARELGVTLRIDRSSYLSQIVDGFRAGDLVSILGNLIDNAIEACQGQEKHVVCCLVQGDEHGLRIVVCDTGKGMSHDEQTKIFDYGYSSKAEEGRGIGLALVKEIVEANQGCIHVESQVGSGTKVEITVHR